MQPGRRLIKTWSKTQAVVALSSAEAELYGAVKGACEGLGSASLREDLGRRGGLQLHMDASAAMGIIERKGVCNMRHLDLNNLWLQEQRAKMEIPMNKVKGTENPADLFTKHLTSASGIETLLHAFGCVYRSGRPENAPELRQGMGTQAGTRLERLEHAHEATAQEANHNGRGRRRLTAPTKAS